MRWRCIPQKEFHSTYQISQYRITVLRSKWSFQAENKAQSGANVSLHTHCNRFAISNEIFCQYQIIVIVTSDIENMIFLIFLTPSIHQLKLQILFIFLLFNISTWIASRDWFSQLNPVLGIHFLKSQPLHVSLADLDDFFPEIPSSALFAQRSPRLLVETMGF